LNVVEQIYLADYNHDKAEQSVLWTLSADVGNGYQCLRPVNNVNLNMDAKAADGHVGGIRDGNELILFEWKKQSNQKWKLQPIHCKQSNNNKLSFKLFIESSIISVSLSIERTEGSCYLKFYHL